MPAGRVGQAKKAYGAAAAAIVVVKMLDKLVRRQTLAEDELADGIAAAIALAVTLT